MGAKNSKREAPYGSTPPRGSPSAKVSRSRSLPTRVFSRRPSHDYGWTSRGKPLLEDVDGIDPAIEYERLVELEKLHGKEGTGFCGVTEEDIIRSCISSPRRGSREEIIYEEEEQDDFVGPGNAQQTTVGSLKASPAFLRRAGRSRLSSQSASCLDEFLGEAEGYEAVNVVPEVVVVDPVVVADGLSVGEDSGKPVLEVTEDTSAKFQEDSLDSPKNCDSNLSFPPCVTESVDQSLNLEPLGVDSASKPSSELPCDGNGSDVCEGELLLERNSCTTGSGSWDKATESGCFDTVESYRKATSDIVLREASYHALQVQEYAEKPRTWKRLSRTICDKRNSGSDHRGRVGEGNMTGKGKVNLSFNSSGKRQPGSRRNSFTDSRDCDWDSSPGKRMKDGVAGEGATPSDLQPDAFAWGWMSQTDAFLGYDASGFLGKGPAGGQQLNGGYVRRSPKKTSRGTALARKVRGLRASPKPVSSLESCLRAQVADPRISNRVKAVSRPLNFSSSVAGEAKVEDASMIDNGTASPLSVGNAVDESTSKRRQSALPKLPNLSKFLKEYAAKLAISSKAESSTDGRSSRPSVQANDPASSSADDGNYSERPSFESLLFSFGVGLGVLFGSCPHKLEAQRLRQLLEETQVNLETLKLELARRKSPARTNVFDSTTGGISKVQYIKGSHCESEQQEDQMAELEAELEAELDQLTGGDSATIASQYSALDELDMDASVVYGDLAPTGLPAGVEEDTDEDLSPPGRPAALNNYAVSPRELTRLLRKLQTARQEELITELEEDLDAALSKLQIREKELEVWKDKVRLLTEGSFVSASGDKFLTSYLPTEVVALVGRNSSIRAEASEASAAPRSDDSRGGQERSHLLMLENGAPASSTVSEEDPAGPGSHPRLGAVSQGEVKSSLHTESAKQDSKDVGRKNSDASELSADDDASNEFMQLMIRFEDEVSSEVDVSARDCNPILDNAQIITQLIDSVHGLESYGDRAESVEMGSATPSLGLFSSSVSISDTWDYPLESATPEGFNGGVNRGTSFPRAKLGVPHPSRRTSWNSDLGNPLLIGKLDNEKASSLDASQCTDVVRYSEAREASKSVSDMSEAETADYRTTDIPYSVKYIDSTMKPASEVEVEVEVGVGRAGLTTPVEKVKQQLFKTPQSASVKWPGDLSPTVLEKIARWEGLMEGETPGPATGSDWECQSRASESEQQCAPDSEYDDVNVFSEENLVLEAEEMLGRMLIKRIVEKSRLGSDSLVKKAQSALATLERDDGVETDVYHVEDTYMNDRTDSEADFSDDNGEKQKTGFLDAAVREEYEFFRRLEIISKDRKAMKGAKEKGAKEVANPGGVEVETIPELNLGSNAQLSPGSRRYGALSKDGEKQPEKEKFVKQAAEPKSRERHDWLSRGVDRQEYTSRGSGNREDEVRSRRRL